jgi:hypothetical protein
MASPMAPNPLLANPSSQGLGAMMADQVNAELARRQKQRQTGQQPTLGDNPPIDPQALGMLAGRMA